MQPGRKRRQLESVIGHMRRDVLALRKQYPRPTTQRHGHGVRLKQSRSRLTVMPPRKATASPS
eukprot:745344-Rhodomonas_salina.1